jgi:AcrR family transcriptional regulator
MGMNMPQRMTYPKRPIRTQKLKTERHQQILEAAFEEFAANGFEAARLDDVARRAGIAKGTIYLYFKNKEVLFRDVVRSLIHPAFDKFDTVVTASSRSARELLRDLLSRLYTEVVRNSKARMMLRLLIAESGNFPRLSDIWHREVIDRGMAAFRLVVNRGVRSGEFRTTTIVDFPQILVAPAILAAVWKLIFGERQRLDLDAYFHRHLDFVLSGLGQRGRPRGVPVKGMLLQK